MQNLFTISNAKLLLLTSLFLNTMTVQAQNVDVTFGVSDFSTGITIDGHISFDENPSSIETNNPGGAPEYYRYYDYFNFEGVGFSTLSYNLNLPGFYRYSDILDEDQRYFFVDRGSDYLFGGLAPNGLGMRLDFSELAKPVNAVGMAWGNVQSFQGQPSPCCIRQTFVFTFDNGSTETVVLNPTNFYLGLNREMLMSDYIGFTATSGSILSIDIIQLGHNPGIDNVAFGTKGVQRQTPRPRVVVTNGSQNPIQRIRISDLDRELQSLAERKGGFCEASDRSLEVADDAGKLRLVPLIGQIGKTYLRALENFAERGVASIKNDTCEDPPRFDYDLEAIYEESELATNFTLEFGNQYETLDDFFRSFQYVVAAEQLALDSLERLQGAMLDESESGIEKQQKQMEHWISEVDYSYESLSNQAATLNQYFSEVGIDDAGDGTSSLYAFTSSLSQYFLDMRVQSIMLAPASPPLEAQLLTPTGVVDNLSPAFTWTPTSSSTWYYLWITDSLGNSIRKWYTAEDAGCADGISNCSVIADQEISDVATWWIKTWNTNGFGPWSSGLRFSTVPLTMPNPVAPIGGGAGTSPAFTWNPIAGSTWYQLWVNDDGNNVHNKWYQAAEINCAGAVNVCEISPNVNVTNDGRWWVRGWNNFGPGPWTTVSSFSR